MDASLRWHDEMGVETRRPIVLENWLSYSANLMPCFTRLFEIAGKPPIFIVSNGRYARCL